MNIGFWMDSPLNMRPETETTAYLMWCASRRGHTVFYFDSGDVDTAGCSASAHEVRPCRPDSVRDYWKVVLRSLSDGTSLTFSLSELDALWYRKNPPLDREKVPTLSAGCTLPFTLNDFNGLVSSADKRNILTFPHLTPRTRLISNRDELEKVFAGHDGEVVLKPLDGFGGRGVRKGTLRELLRAGISGPFPLIAQEFLPDVYGGDVRVLLLDGEPIGAMKRIPAPGEFRANVFAGGRVVRHTPDEGQLRVCRELAGPLRSRGLSFVGLDLIGEKVIEINCVSPGGIPRINALSNVRLEERALDFLEQRIYDSSF